MVLGALPLAGVAVQALIGGVTVLTGLNPGVVAVHFLVSMGLIAVSAVLVLAAWEGSETRELSPSPISLKVLALALSVALAVVLALGTLVTGSGPHSGDADDPNRFPVNVATAARAHSGSVWVFVLLVITLLVVVQRRGLSGKAARALAAVTVVQAVIGYVQYALNVPVALVALHMLGATLLVVATTVAVYPLLRGKPVTGPAALGELGPLAGEDEAHEALPVQR
jgi:cytochrome c oxidase assembly protein subunit 15